MNYELERLLREREEALNEEVSFDKFDGMPFSGAKIKIKWKGRSNTDEGYLFALPINDIDIDDYFVHVQNPDNEDGMDDAPPVWLHLWDLLNNDRVKSVKIAQKEN